MALPNVFNKSLHIYRGICWLGFHHTKSLFPSKLTKAMSAQGVIPSSQPACFHQSICHQTVYSFQNNSTVRDHSLQNDHSRRGCEACSRLLHTCPSLLQNKWRLRNSHISQNKYPALASYIQLLQNERRWKNYHSPEKNSYCVLMSCIQSFSTTGRQHSHKSDTSSTEESAVKRSAEKGVMERHGGHISLESEEDLMRLTKEVMKEAKKMDVMVDTVPQSTVEQLILDLHNSGFLPFHIASLLSSHPILLLQHRSVLPTVHLFLNHGLDSSQVMTLLHGFPAVTKIAATRIEQTMDALRSGCFQEHSIGKIITGNPTMLVVPAAKLTQRLGMLRQLFKSADVIALVVDCPQVLTDEWKDLQAKFDYVFHEMKITQRQMVYASIFTHPLSHIQQRHAFLVRAGFYSMGKRREGEKNPNARLDQIISSSDHAFCRRFGGFDVTEYKAFCQLYHREKLIEGESDSESDLENV